MMIHNQEFKQTSIVSAFLTSSFFLYLFYLLLQVLSSRIIIPRLRSKLLIKCNQSVCKSVLWIAVDRETKLHYFTTANYHKLPLT